MLKMDLLLPTKTVVHGYNIGLCLLMIMNTNSDIEKIERVLSKISSKELKEFVRWYAYTHEDLATALVEK